MLFVVVLLLCLGSAYADVEMRLMQDGTIEKVVHYHNEYMPAKIPGEIIYVQCVHTEDCNTKVEPRELQYLWAYKNMVHNVSKMQMEHSYRFGLLRNQYSENIMGMFVLHSNTDISFWIRVTNTHGYVYDKYPDDIKAFLIAELAVHERAHYDSYLRYGILGHGDAFQRVFNVLMHDVLVRADTYKEIMRTAMHPYKSTVQSGALIGAGILVLLLAYTFGG